MIFLGIETSTSCGSIALAERDRVLAEWNLNLSKTHSERLLPDLAHMLLSAGMKMDQIDVIAVSIGPGSFTGLRIGLTTAKALALAKAKPMVGIPTLDVLAENVLTSEILVCPALDARRGELFASLYRREPPGRSSRVTEYLSVTPERLMERIGEPTLFLGDGALLYRDRLLSQASHEICFAPLEYNAPRATALCRLALQKYSVEGGIHARDIQALYVRASDSEFIRSQKHHP